MFSNHIEYLLRLHGAAERGHQIEQRYVELMTQLEAELGVHLGRIRADAADALGRRRSLGGEQRMAEALEAAIREINRAMVLLHGGAPAGSAEGLAPIRNAS